MELKDVVSKIVGNGELKAKLRSLKSFDEVYDFFVANGYEGDENELKEKLFKGFSPFRALTDEDLTGISGGISGRQVLSACMGLMMLTGLAPNMLGTTSYAGAKSAESSATKVVGKQSFGSKLRQKLSRLGEKLGIVKTGSKQIKPKSAKELKKEEHEKLLRFADLYTDVYMCYYTTLAESNLVEHPKEEGKPFDRVLGCKLYAFGKIGALKYGADFSNFETGIDVTEYKAKYDKLMAETDFEHFDMRTFDSKLKDIADSRPESVAALMPGDDKYKEMLNTGLSKSEKSDMLKSLDKKMSALDEQFGISQYDKLAVSRSHVHTCMVLAGENFDIDVDTADGIKEVVKMMGMSKKEFEELKKMLEQFES